MAHTLRPSKKISYNENEIDPSEYLTDIKKEPVDNHDEQESFGVKNEHFEYQNGSNFDTNDPYPASSNIWELLGGSNGRTGYFQGFQGMLLDSKWNKMSGLHILDI